MVKRVAFVIPDLHFEKQDPRFIILTTKIIKLLKPDYIVQLGDALDAGGISSYLQLAGEETKLIEEIKAYSKQLDRWQAVMKRGAEFHQLEGNHEQRLSRYIAKHCRDLNELIRPMPELLGFRERKNFYWHPYNKWESCKIGDVHYHHGMYFDKHVAASNLTRYGVKFIQGHAHRFGFVSKDKIWSVCLGHGSIDKKTAHVFGPNDHQQALGIVTYTDKCGHFEPVLVDGGKAVFRGQEIKA